MNKDQKKSDPESEADSPPEDSFTESNEASHEQECLKSEQIKKSKEEIPINENSSVEKKSFGGKFWLFFLVIFTTLGIGAYFQGNRLDIFKKFSSNLNIPSPPTQNISSNLDTKSKKTPFKSIKNVSEQTKSFNSPEKIILENEKTINLLREEVQSLKAELQQNNPSLLPQNVQSEIQQPKDSILDKKIDKINPTKNDESISEVETLLLKPSLPIKIESKDNIKPVEKKINDVNQAKEHESISEVETSLVHASPVKAKPLIEQSQPEKISPQRSEEVQAYLDFVENTGTKLIDLFKKGWVSLQNLIL